MFEKKPREITVTETSCTLLEDVRLALEVYYGKRIRFRHFQIGSARISGDAAFYVDTISPVDYRVEFRRRGSSDLVDMKIGDTEYLARFDNPDKVRIIRIDGHENPVWMVGTSAADTHPEPLHS